MLARMPMRTLFEWMAYYNMDPFGPHRADAQAALMPWVYAYAHRGKGGREPQLSDFVLSFDGSNHRPQKTPEQLAMVMRAAAKQHNLANAMRKRGRKKRG